ncbi:hypothetical protein RB195_008820 [Necator americanus]|uniref:Uncharacterized protein n=1 Tax=Necator americanus TaxID=51031 RepID=A0ABR1CQH0_NECAM
MSPCPLTETLFRGSASVNTGARPPPPINMGPPLGTWSHLTNVRNAVVKLDANVAKEVHAKKIVSVARKVANVGRTVNVKATNVAVMRNVVEVKRNAVLRVRNAVKRKHAASRCNRLRLDLWRYGTIGSTVINSISLLLFFFA